MEGSWLQVSGGSLHLRKVWWGKLDWGGGRNSGEGLCGLKVGWWRKGMGASNLPLKFYTEDSQFRWEHAKPAVSCRRRGGGRPHRVAFGPRLWPGRWAALGRGVPRLQLAGSTKKLTSNYWLNWGGWPAVADDQVLWRALTGATSFRTAWNYSGDIETKLPIMGLA